ncbi:hypothetical protein GNI_171930, partial [Gregarina niphandrodes]
MAHGLNFTVEINRAIRHKLLRLVQDIYGSHAPYNPPPHVMTQCDLLL